MNMFWIIMFILIWICSVVVHIIWTYYENKHTIYNIGDLIDEVDLFAWLPVINTFYSIGVIVAFMIKIILLKLNVLWEKFRNIKLK